MWETRVWSLGQEDPLEKKMATHSNITLYLDVPCLMNFRILMDMVLNVPVCVVVSLLCCGILRLVLRNLLFTLPKGKPFCQNGWREEAFPWVCGIRKEIDLVAGGNRPWCLSCAWERASSLDLIEVPSEDTKLWIHQSKYKTHDRCQGTELFFKKMLCKSVVWQDKGKPASKACGICFWE